MYVTATLGRPAYEITPDTFADITSSAVLSITPIGGGITVEFADALDGPTQAAVAARCGSATDTQDHIRQAATQALTACRAYLNNPAPSQADALAQVRLLTQISIRLIRLVLNELDGTD